MRRTSVLTLERRFATHTLELVYALSRTFFLVTGGRVVDDGNPLISVTRYIYKIQLSVRYVL